MGVRVKIQQTMRRIVQRSASLIVKRTALVVVGFILVSGGIIGTQSFLGTIPTSYASTPPDSCFSFYVANNEIFGYWDNEDNNPANPACPRSINIPATINGHPVTTIGSSAFSNKSLTAVTIPNSVTTIKWHAFEGNLLTTIAVPDSVTTIEMGGFQNNQLASVTLPASLATIGSFAFADNLLTSVSIPATVTTIDTYAFKNNLLNSVDLPEGLTTLNTGAFAHNHLSSFTLPDSITILGDYVLSDNQLSSITLPSTMTEIGDGALSGNSLGTIELPDSLVRIGNNALFQNHLTSLVIPNSVTTIGNYALYDNQLISITIPSSVTTIGNGAFTRNYLTALTIPDSVTSLGNSTFSVNNLTSLTLGNGLTAIGDDVFSVNKLQSVTLPASISSVDPDAFTLQSPWGRALYDSSDPAHDPWGGDQNVTNMVYNNLWLVQLHTAGLTPIKNAIIPEDWFMGEDLNNDGENNVVGGHIINPASVEVKYRTAAGVDIAAANILTGKKTDETPLSSYLASPLVPPTVADPTAPTASEQQAIDETLSVFFRKGQTVSLTAPTITGYQLTSPVSPVNVSLPNTANIFTFTYGLIPEQPTTSTPAPVPEPTPAKRTVTAAPRTSTDGAAPTPTSLEMSRSLVQFADPTGSANGPTDATPADIGELFKSSAVSADESLPCHNISSASLLSPTSFDTPDTNATTLGGVALTVECSEESGKGSASLTFGEEISDIGAIRVYQPITSGRAIDVTDQVTLRSATTDGVTKTILTYPLQDGTTLDTDGAANSSITSKLYLVRLAKSSTPTKDTQQAKAQANAAPTWFPLALAIGGALLVGGLVTAGIAIYRRR